MANLSTQKTPMPELNPNERVKHFNEVALGYTLEQAKDEAARCLSCKHRTLAQRRARA